MKRYRLKDRELQRRLDEFSAGEFSKNLRQFDDDTFASYWGKLILVHGFVPVMQEQFRVLFTRGEVDEESEGVPSEQRIDVRPTDEVYLRAGLDGSVHRVELRPKEEDEK